MGLSGGEKRECIVRVEGDLRPLCCHEVSSIFSRLVGTSGETGNATKVD